MNPNPPSATLDNLATVEILSEDNPSDRERLAALRADPAIAEMDTVDGQRASLMAVFPRVDDAVLAEPPRWVHYPWRSRLVRVLGPVAFARLRLDRNRDKITAAEQERLRGVSVGVIGLSVGHAVAHTLAIEGLAGTLRLADFDELDLSNLNRVPASVMDLGLNKAVVAARRIAEIDPYVRVEVMRSGVDESTVEEFLTGLDIVVEECDSFDAKVLVRDRARALGIPVIMETSDGGVLDVERYDLDRNRPLFHGLLGSIDVAGLAGLSTAEKVPLGLALLDPRRVTSRMAASAVELGRTIATWPQLGGDVALGGATCAAAVRRLALGLALPSGRTRIDIDSHLDALTDPLTEPPTPAAPTGLTGAPADIGAVFAALPARAAVTYAGSRAPSAGNSQPWQVTDDDDGITVTLDERHRQIADIDHRAGAVALGGFAHNVEVAASARSIAGALTITGSGAQTSLRYTFGSCGDTELPDTVLTDTVSPDDVLPDTVLTDDVSAMLARATDRRPGDGGVLTAQERTELEGSVAPRDAVARILTSPSDIARCAEILAAHDRIRYLTPSLHREMVGELRWPDSTADPDTGLTLDTLGMGPDGLGMLDVMRRGEVMAHLDEWNAGSALGGPTRALVRSSSAVVAVCQNGDSGSDFVRGGMAAQALWVRATALGLSVCPTTPISLYARDDADRAELSPTRAGELSRLDADLAALFGVRGEETVAMVMRVFRADGAPPVSRRRALPAGGQAPSD